MGCAAMLLLQAHTKSNARNANRQTYLDQVHFTTARANQSALPGAALSMG